MSPPMPRHPCGIRRARLMRELLRRVSQFGALIYSVELETPSPRTLSGRPRVIPLYQGHRTWREEFGICTAIGSRTSLPSARVRLLGTGPGDCREQATAARRTPDQHEWSRRPRASSRPLSQRPRADHARMLPNKSRIGGGPRAAPPMQLPQTRSYAAVRAGQTDSRAHLISGARVIELLSI